MDIRQKLHKTAKIDDVMSQPARLHEVDGIGRKISFEVKTWVPFVTHILTTQVVCETSQRLHFGILNFACKDVATNFYGH